MASRALRAALMAAATSAESELPAGFAALYRALAEDETDRSTYTFTGVAFGPASADRKLVVIVSAKHAAGQSITAVTIGGVNAFANPIVAPSSATSRILAAYFAEVPTGTTGDVVVTFDGTMSSCSVAIIAVTGSTQPSYGVRSNATPNVGSGIDLLSTAPPMTVPAGHIAFAAALVDVASSISWSQTSGTGTELVDEQIGVSFGFGLYTSAATGPQSFTADSTNGVIYRALAFTWGP